MDEIGDVRRFYSKKAPAAVAGINAPLAGLSVLFLCIVKCLFFSIFYV